MNRSDAKAVRDLFKVSAELSALSRVCSALPWAYDPEYVAGELADLSMRSYDATMTFSLICAELSEVPGADEYTSDVRRFEGLVTTPGSADPVKLSRKGARKGLLSLFGRKQQGGSGGPVPAEEVAVPTFVRRSPK